MRSQPTWQHGVARGQHIRRGGAARKDGDGWVQAERLLHHRSQVGQLFKVVVRGSPAACKQVNQGGCSGAVQSQEDGVLSHNMPAVSLRQSASRLC